MLWDFSSVFSQPRRFILLPRRFILPPRRFILLTERMIRLPASMGHILNRVPKGMHVPTLSGVPLSTQLHSRHGTCCSSIFSNKRVACPVRARTKGAKLAFHDITSEHRHTDTHLRSNSARGIRGISRTLDAESYSLGLC